MKNNLINPHTKKWGDDQLIVSIDGNKTIFHGSCNFNKIMKFINKALIENKEVQLSFLPVDTNLEFVGSIDTTYNLERLIN